MEEASQLLSCTRVAKACSAKVVNRLALVNFFVAHCSFANLTYLF